MSSSKKYIRESMSTRSAKLSGKSGKSERSSHSYLDEARLPLQSTLYILSQIEMFFALCVIVLGSIVYAYFENSQCLGVFGGVLMFICGLIGNYTNTRPFLIFNLVFSLVCAVGTFYFWYLTIRWYQTFDKYAKCMEYTFAQDDDYFHPGWMSACQTAKPEFDCYCVDKHASVCAAYKMQSLLAVNCDDILLNYKYEVAGVLGGLTIGTVALVAYVIVAFCSLCYACLSQLTTPEWMKTCYRIVCCKKQAPIAPQEEEEDDERVERGMNRVISNMLMEAADNAYSSQKIVEREERTGQLGGVRGASRKVVVWEDEPYIEVKAPDREEASVVSHDGSSTVRREEEFVADYVAHKYPHLVPHDETRHEKRVVKPHLTHYPTALQQTLAAVIEHPVSERALVPVGTSVSSALSVGSSSVKSPQQQPQQLKQPQPLVVFKPKLPPPAAALRRGPVLDSSDTSDSEASTSLDGQHHGPLVDLDEEYERPPGPYEGRFDYLDGAISAKVAARIAAYQADLCEDPSLQDNSFSLLPTGAGGGGADDHYPLTSVDSLTLGDRVGAGGVGPGRIRADGVSTLQDWNPEDSLWTEGPYLTVSPDHTLILMPLQDTLPPETRSPRPHEVFTHAPPLAQQHLADAVFSAQVPREARKYVHNRQYKQQMYLYQQY